MAGGLGSIPGPGQGSKIPICHAGQERKEGRKERREGERKTERKAGGWGAQRTMAGWRWVALGSPRVWHSGGFPGLLGFPSRVEGFQGRQ